MRITGYQVLFNFTHFHSKPKETKERRFHSTVKKKKINQNYYSDIICEVFLQRAVTQTIPYLKCMEPERVLRSQNICAYVMRHLEDGAEVQNQSSFTFHISLMHVT